MPHFDTIVLIGAGVIVTAIVGVRVGSKIGLPSLLLFLGLGILLGDSVLGLHFSDAQLAHDWGMFALAVILAEGGLTTKWSEIKPSMLPATLLATVGVVISIGVVALFAHFVLGLSLWLSILLGAVLSPTDAAAVFSVLRAVPIPHRIRGALEAESGLNDAPTILLVGVAAAAAAAQSPEASTDILDLVVMIVVELVGGAVLGLLAGWLGAVVLRRLALPVSGLYPIAVFTWVLLVYETGASLHVSGFAAAYVCAVVVGNADLPHKATTRSFVEGVGWLAQIGLFVMLGLLASPSRISLQSVGFGLAAGVVLTFVARPLAVWACTTWFIPGWRPKAFLSWAGLRGAVPIVLTTIPMAKQVPYASQLFDMVLVFVVVFTLLQAPTLPWLARRLGLVDPSQAGDVDIEIAALERAKAELLQVMVPAGSQLAGLFINELRLPRDVSVSLIVRDGVPFTPDAVERIKIGDELVLVAPTARRDEAVRRIRSLARGGRLARWRGVPGDD